MVTCWINSMWPTDACTCMQWWNRPSLVRIMACRLFGTKPLSVSMVAYCKLELWQQIAVKFESRCNSFNDVIMGAVASQITSITIFYSIVYLDADQRKHQSSASLAFVRGMMTSSWNIVNNMVAILSPSQNVVTSMYKIMNDWGSLFIVQPLKFGNG